MRDCKHAASGVKVMDLKCWSMILLILVSVMSSSVHAVSLECNGNIVSVGISEEQLLDACGEPTSRNGANWVFHISDLVDTSKLA